MHMHTVTAHRPRQYDTERIKERLGDDAVEVARFAAPSILVDGQFHHEVNRWLELRTEQLRNDQTVWDNARLLRAWIAFLADRHATVHEATEQDYRDFEAIRRFPADGSPPCADTTWQRHASVIKQFHEWLRDVYGTRLPFQLVTKVRPDGRTTTGIRHAGRMTKGRSGALPLDPTFANELVAATSRRTPGGQERADAVRDRAFIQLLLAVGIRLGAASVLTHYELPVPAAGPLTTLHLPAAIRKYRRGVDGYAFTARLTDVVHYVAGERRLAAAGTVYDPQNSSLTRDLRDRSPIRVVDAGPDRVKLQYPDGNVVGRAWDDVDSSTRLRLVDRDGTTPLLFLKSTGSPLTPRSLRHIVSEAGRAAHRTNPRFPQRTYPHMLRHTFATHMAAVWVRGIPNGDPDAGPRGDMNVVNAVEVVQHQLGHSDARTTRIYTQYVSLLLSEPLNALLGEPDA